MEIENKRIRRKYKIPGHALHEKVSQRQKGVAPLRSHRSNPKPEHTRSRAGRGGARRRGGRAGAGRAGAGRAGAGRGRAGRIGTGRSGSGRERTAAGRCAKKTTVHLAFQGTEDNSPGHLFGSTNKRNPM